MNSGNTEHYSILRNGSPVSYSDVISSWRDDQPFREWFSQLLVDSSFKAYRWETPGVTANTLDREFEFVLLQCDSLVRRVDAATFEDYFEASVEVATFPNLSGDAMLVVPCPVADNSVYGHLASFMRGAPKSQVNSLWQSVANAMLQRVDDRPVWLSTAGMGVSWLHVRLDKSPKYYGHVPFRAKPQ